MNEDRDVGINIPGEILLTFVSLHHQQQHSVWYEFWLFPFCSNYNAEKGLDMLHLMGIVNQSLCCYGSKFNSNLLNNLNWTL